MAHNDAVGNGEQALARSPGPRHQPAPHALLAHREPHREGVLPQVFIHLNCVFRALVSQPGGEKPWLVEAEALQLLRVLGQCG